MQTTLSQLYCIREQKLLLCYLQQVLLHMEKTLPVWDLAALVCPSLYVSLLADSWRNPSGNEWAGHLHKLHELHTSHTPLLKKHNDSCKNKSFHVLWARSQTVNVITRCGNINEHILCLFLPKF